MPILEGPPKNFKGRFYRQLASTYFILAYLFCASFSFLAVYIVQRLNERAVQIDYWQLAANLSNELQPYTDPTVDNIEVRRILERFQRYAPKFWLCLLDGGGMPIIEVCDLRTDVPSQTIATIEAALADKSPIPAAYHLVVNKNTKVPFSVARLRVAGDPAYVLILLQKSSWTPAMEIIFVDAGIIAGILAMIAAFLVSVVLGHHIFRVLTRNLYELLDTVRSYRDGVFTRRTRIQSSNEIGELGWAVNDMADRIVSSIKELERRDELRRELIANIAHDLRAPAAGIVGLADTLAVRQHSLSDSDYKCCIEGIIDCGESLSRMVSELFDLSRFEAGEIKCNKAIVVIDKLFEGAIARAHSLAKREEIRLHSFVTKPGCEVYCDPYLIGRALDNLIGNALKFTSAGGEICLLAEPQNASILISVRDTGSGISESDIEKIFTRGNRLSASEESLGLGLGLAIVSQIVKLHGGRVQLQSELGKGSTFSFALEGFSSES